jgi:hypothetical protein
MSAGKRRLRGQGREKHSAFFRLVEACTSGDCPVCHLCSRRVAQYFDGLLYEKVNDPEMRRRFRSAGGFCGPHSVQFMGRHDGLAGSILYRDLLSSWLERRSAFPVQDSSGALDDCPACQTKERTEDSFLSLLTDYLQDQQLKQALSSSAGLCLPHLSLLEGRLQAVRATLPGWLVDLQTSLVERIAADLEAYISSCNFSLSRKGPIQGKEGEAAWEKAIFLISGRS